MISAEKTHPTLRKPISGIHELLPGLFFAEAAMMRGYAYWAPAGTVFEEKLAASTLSYLHMRNADDALRLMDFMLYPRPEAVFDPGAGRRTAAIATAPNFLDAIAGPGAERPEESVRALDAMVGATALYDYHIVEAGQTILARYKRIDHIRLALQAADRDPSKWLA
ncbi:hypothetical protein Q2941_48275 [Bradyrhizobium sp. UFLA05-153]